MKRWVVFHGKCLFVFGIILFILSIFAIKEYFDAKKVHTDLYHRVHSIEYKLTEVYGGDWR